MSVSGIGVIGDCNKPIARAGYPGSERGSNPRPPPPCAIAGGSHFSPEERLFRLNVFFAPEPFELLVGRARMNPLVSLFVLFLKDSCWFFSRLKYRHFQTINRTLHPVGELTGTPPPEAPDLNASSRTRATMCVFYCGRYCVY